MRKFADYSMSNQNYHKAHTLVLYKIVPTEINLQALKI